jgi:ABC-type bacteriocin/lantibiotic exporter with double-glycine peptidase domain
MTCSPWRRHLVHFRASVGTLAASVALSTVLAALVLPVPLLVARVIDHSIPEHRRGELIAIGVAVVALTALASGLSVLERRIALRLTKRITRELRESMLDKIYRLSRQHYDTTPMPELHDRLVTHADRVDFATTILLRDVVPGAVLAFAMLSLLFARSPLLTGVTVVVGGLSLIVNRVSDKTLEKRFESYHSAFETYSAGVISSLRAQDLTRAHAAELCEQDQRSRDARAVEHSGIRRSLALAVHGAAHQTITAMVGASILIVGGLATIDGSMTIGTVLSFFAGFALLRGPLTAMNGAFPNLIEGQASLAKIHELLDRTDERPYSGTTRLEVVGALSMRNVTFGYGSGPPVLQSFSLELQPHCVTALVGPNGSGKSSVVNLVLGHYRPTIGEVCIDGLRYDDADLAHVLRHIGIVPQDPFFFAASIRENLTYGSSTISADDIRWAIRMAGAQSIVDALPLGLDTVLGEDARSLSGGQRQRIAIARALVRRPKILILDEPTNHLDRNGIAEVLANLRSWADRPAVLIVSHHSEAVDMADHVVNLRATGAAQPVA